MATLEALTTARRIVIKVGSALLVEASTGHIRDSWLASLATDVARLKASGCQVILVSSGAVALGRQYLGTGADLESKQAAAAIGQVILASAWRDAFAPHDIVTAQALLTLNDTEDRRRWLNGRATLMRLVDAGVIPVINENDTIATDEIRYGDNDRLAARTAQLAGADLLILLSDIDGLYTADPRSDSAAQHLPEITDITPGIRKMAGGPNQTRGAGSGGMQTKIMAAEIAVRSGCGMIIMNGEAPAPLTRLENGDRASYFVPQATPDKARKSWISGALKPKGRLIIDAGAARALQSGKSLLPVGLSTVEGRFGKGDAVEICDLEGRVLARGLTRYDAAEARALAGVKSTEIETVLGYHGSDVLVHRDDMAMLS